MNVYIAILSGIMQGLTEYFPVSSSGHLVLLHHFFGLKEPLVTFDVMLHLGTLLGVVVYFRDDIVRVFTVEKKLGLGVIIGTIPAAVVGLFFKDAIERFFADPRAVSALIVVTGIWLFIAHGAARRRKSLKRADRNIGIVSSLAIGCAQCFGILPGISRSGSTIGAALIAGANARDAFRFSFLLSIPAILGATVLQLGDSFAVIGGRDMLYFVLGGLTAAVVGIGSLTVLSFLMRTDRLYLFGIYCVAVGCAAFSII